jgi:predicted GIY-YIG superfamily endonuclease
MAYIYAHKRKDKNQIFYIGVSSLDNYNRAYYKYNRGSIWNLIVKKTPYDIVIIHENISLKTALVLEKKLINYFGRINKKTGILSNLTDGGDGMYGLVHTTKSKLKMRESQINLHRNGYISPMKGKKTPQEVREKISNSCKGRTAWNKGKKLSKEQAELLRTYNLGRVQTLQERIKRANSNKGKTRNRKKIINTKSNTVFDSINDAIIHSGLTKTTFYRKLKNNQINYTYI